MKLIRIRFALLTGLALCLATGADGRAPADPTGPARQMEQARQLFESGRYLEAVDSFDLAARLLEGTLFQDDADFWRIRSLEAAGQDSGARGLWPRWRFDHPDSPLAAEAEIARAWNLVRNGDPAGARTIMESLVASGQWLEGDPRVQTVLAVSACLDRSFTTALEHLTLVRHAGGITPVGLMVEGLSQQALGQEYAAAVAYQELLDEHPDSHLTGYALMAKGGIFPGQENFRAAAAEFTRSAARTSRQDQRAEAEYLAAACIFLGGDQQLGLEAMHTVAVTYAGNLAFGDELAARALFSMGEMRWLQGEYEQAIVRFSEVLSNHFASDLAGSALYRTGRCLDALGRTTEANSTYQAVAQGYPYAPEAPAAVYLAGVGLYEQGHYLASAPYFQLVIDRYAGSGAAFVFDSPEHQELVEASLCLLEFAFYEAGEAGLMAGAPHLALQKMPPSDSMWRAYTLLLDADALAAVDRFPESQETLATLLTEFPDHPVGIRANRLLAWTYARQGRQDLAIATEEAMVARYSARNDRENLGAALLTIAHGHFNAKRYDQAAPLYREYVQRFPDQGHKLGALYQEGLCYVRLGRAGDAVDCWQLITSEAPGSNEARKAWQRSGDILFQAGHYDRAREQFSSLQEYFPDEAAQASATLRLGRCDYNEGRGQAALGHFRNVVTGYPNSTEAAEAVEGITQILYGLGRDGDTAALEDLAVNYPDSPLAPEAGFELALVQYEAGAYTQAAEAFDDLCGKYPRYSAADRHFFFAADAWEKAGQTDRARTAWTGFLRYFPHSELAAAGLFHLAGIRFNDGNYHQAVQEFSQVLTMPADGEIHDAALFNLAMSHRILGDNELALSALQQYTAGTRPTSDREILAARTLGEIHQELGHLREAARRYQAAVDLGATPEEAIELNYLAGVCLKQAGDFQGALGAYAQSIAAQDKTNNFRLSALAQTADLHEQGGDFAGALTAYRDLIENATDPTLVGAAKNRIAQLEAALGR